jgi:diguanylate cyclase (GGDEF)-like protein
MDSINDGIGEDDLLERTVSGEGLDESRQTRRYPYLTVYSGPEAGLRYPLMLRPQTIGRSHQADIIVDDRKVSKIHCTIGFDGQLITVRDNGSTNGVFVNGSRVSEAVLKNNSHLLLGDTSLKLDFKDPDELAFEDDLIRKATTDPLTAIPNRAFFEKRAHEELSFARRSAMPIALAMIDIDLFKSVNDSRGHQAGDYAISRIAQLIYAQKRLEDLLARYGGEEFVLLLRGTSSRANAVAICERIRTAIADYPLSFNGEVFHLTISIGLSFRKGNEIDGLDDLVRDADTALYRAKGNGRNRVEIAGD